MSKNKITILYTTPNGLWQIYQQSDLVGEPLFTLWRKFEGKNSTDEWHFKLYRKKVDTILRWLRWNKQISSDEMKYQIGLLNTLDK